MARRKQNQKRNVRRKRKGLPYKRTVKANFVGPLRPGQRRGIRGRGDYTVDPDIANVVGGIGAGIGTMIGQGDAGKAAALSLHRLFKRVTGYGDYTVQNNTLLAGDTPKFMRDGRSVNVCHTESFQLTKSSTAFLLQSWAITPGNRFMFPWLWSVAQAFQQYRFNGLIFRLESLALGAIATTHLNSGSNLLATQYNIYDKDFTSSQAMLNTMYSNSGKPQEDILHPIECARGESQVQLLSIYPGGQGLPPPSTAGQDYRLYCLGKLCWAAEGYQTAGDVIARLHVSYDIDFFKNIEDSPAPAVDHWNLVSFTSGAPLGTLPLTVAPETLLSGNVISMTGNSLTFHPNYTGYVRIAYATYGTSGTTTVPSITGDGTYAISVSGIISDQEPALPITNSTGSVSNIAAFQIVPGGVPVITFGASTVPIGQVGGDLFVTYLQSI